jgi:Zn-dependent M28 family amino/carboxypeptidase
MKRTRTFAGMATISLVGTALPIAVLPIAAPQAIAPSAAAATRTPAVRPPAVPPSGARSAARPRLPDMVTARAVRRHQQRLQGIADAHGGNRAAGEPGGLDTVRYVAARLRNYGYNPTVQHFAFDNWGENTAPVLQRTAPERAAYASKTDFLTLRYAGKGDVTARALAVDPAAAGQGSGCETGDFARFRRGAIALIQRGSCTFAEKTENAIAAGAAAVVIYQRPGASGPVLGSLRRPYALPVIGPTHAVGARLVREAQAGALRLRVRTDTFHEVRQSANVIADTARGRADRTVVVGAHHDSVVDGPGVNDNGSGVAGMLAIARQIGRLGALQRNRVRFAFFGAEEYGMIGSQYYVKHLARRERDRIAMMLNFDMLGSPNHVRFVYDGDSPGGSSGGESRPAPPAGSADIEAAFNDYFASRGLPVEPTPLNGRSDYEPFLAAGIPVGGLFSGAEDLKTARQAKIFGGKAGQPYDPCYHKACDTVANVNPAGLDQMVDAAAAVTERFAAGERLPGNRQAGTA